MRHQVQFNHLMNIFTLPIGKNHRIIFQPTSWKKINKNVLGQTFPLRFLEEIYLQGFEVPTWRMQSSSPAGEAKRVKCNSKEAKTALRSSFLSEFFFWLFFLFAGVDFREQSSFQVPVLANFFGSPQFHSLTSRVTSWDLLRLGWLPMRQRCCPGLDPWIPTKRNVAPGFFSPGFKLHATFSATFLADILLLTSARKIYLIGLNFLIYRLEYQISCIL